MTAQDLFERITNDMVAAIEAGTGQWKMPWQRLAESGTPTSVDGRPYRGLNALWLPMVAYDAGWTSGVWGTYKGWQRHGGQVRKGEKGTEVILWKPVTSKDKDDADKTKRHLIARTYTVFAAEQCDGEAVEELLAKRTTVTHDAPERLAEAEAFFAAVGATVRVGGNVACYVPSLDEVRVPELSQFKVAAHYYSTLAHEHTHWTGHKDRLNRDLSGRFGDDAYGAEELVAELGAAFWSAAFGVSAATRDDHAAYLASWLRILKADPKALLTASSKAQAAFDHLVGLANGEEVEDEDEGDEETVAEPGKVAA